MKGRSGIPLRDSSRGDQGISPKPPPPPGAFASDPAPGLGSLQMVESGAPRAFHQLKFWRPRARGDPGPSKSESTRFPPPLPPILSSPPHPLQSHARCTPASTSPHTPARPLPVPRGRGRLAVPYLAALLVAQLCALHVESPRTPRNRPERNRPDAFPAASPLPAREI